MGDLEVAHLPPLMMDRILPSPEGKPGVEEFDEFIAEMIKKNDDDMPFN